MINYYFVIFCVFIFNFKPISSVHSNESGEVEYYARILSSNYKDTLEGSLTYSFWDHGNFARYDISEFEDSISNILFVGDEGRYVFNSNTLISDRKTHFDIVQYVTSNFGNREKIKKSIKIKEIKVLKVKCILYRIEFNYSDCDWYAEICLNDGVLFRAFLSNSKGNRSHDCNGVTEILLKATSYKFKEE